MNGASSKLLHAAAPDFRHIDNWIFDLDNTLYAAESDLFAQISERMTDFVESRLRLPRDDARRLQKDYYRDHGTTLNGLMVLHGTDPEEFLPFVHDIDLSGLLPQPRLRERIAQLPGRKFVFTNGCRDHATRVLAQIALGELFDDIWDIRAIGFLPKPNIASYAAMVERARIAPQRAAMFEDLARNLVPAHALGMTTVWLRNGSHWSKQGPEHPVPSPADIDYETDDLAQFLSSIETAAP
ncbi:MAG TPA: pyrimidine 5'-nucleotidase [Rhizomicrobium sp.]|nr:pyrimidine 5'-nucleotidase [Rhizomicrobium sp.]